MWDPSLLKFDTVCFLDADTIILKNIDHIFNYVIGNTDTRISNNHQAIFAAAPDIGWPDCFNSGVFVMKPDKKVYDALISFASTRGSFDGGDQGLLNSFFSTWASGETLDGVPPSSRLPFTFNVTPSTVYSYLPAYKEFFNDIQVVHFIGTRKPWRMTRNSNGNLTMTYFYI